MCIAVLRLCGVARISVIGLRRDGNRLDLAKKMGADDVLIGDEQDVVSAVLNAGDGFGAHLVVDAVGVSKTLDQSLDLVRPNGQITKIGWGPAPVGFSIDRLVAKAATLQGSFSHLHGTWERILELMGTGQLDVAPLVTEFDLLDWHEGFMAMEELTIPKAVLRPNGTIG
jgi:alcohol dehydrogenase/L-iditol 2-dehydrogenase